MNEPLYGSITFADYVIPVNLEADKQYEILETQAEAANAIVENSDTYHYREIKPLLDSVTYRLPWKPFGADLSEERIDRVLCFDNESGERTDLVYFEDLMPYDFEEIVRDGGDEPETPPSKGDRQSN